jgi:hypothetical protein
LSLYIFNHGAPIGLRLALQRPKAVRALIVPNRNPYVEALRDA